MLSIITASNITPEVEPADRDPGIVSLLAVIVRALRNGAGAAAGRARAAHQRANEAALFSSSSAWPYDHRSH